MDVDKLIEQVRKCQPLKEDDFKEVCLKVGDILIEEPNVVQVPAPCNIVGDVHGQFHDLIRIFDEIGGKLENGENCPNYVFLGDYVDRGYNSLETISLLMLYKIKFPKKIFLLRGNHECRQITLVYGFYDEFQRVYGNGSGWKYCCKVFDCLNVAAVVDNNIFCVHGGLSPSIKTIEQIQVLKRMREIPHEGSFCDLMWSDPENIDAWEVNPRGAGWLFGNKVVQHFNQINGMKLVCRAHQLCNDGYNYQFEESKALVTVWSAPNYCYRCENSASILNINKDHDQDFKIFKETPENRKTAKMLETPKPLYFM